MLRLRQVIKFYLIENNPNRKRVRNTKEEKKNLTSDLKSFINISTKKFNDIR